MLEGVYIEHQLNAYSSALSIAQYVIKINSDTLTGLGVILD
jgi:hypothetical protein